MGPTVADGVQQQRPAHSPEQCPRKARWDQRLPGLRTYWTPPPIRSKPWKTLVPASLTWTLFGGMCWSLLLYAICDCWSHGVRTTSTQSRAEVRSVLISQVTVAAPAEKSATAGGVM